MQKWRDNHVRNQIRGIHKAIINEIQEYGYDVWVSYAHKTKSRYFEFFIDRHKITIRLSDHPSRNACEYNYDIYVDNPRPGAMSFTELMIDLEKLVKSIGNRKMQEKKLHKAI